ncbi:MAG: hypothetical protein HY568_02000 [Candidatus Latescibacteria bacterium]|nr:hypothetical protein [Candidatus Latescibacterota bacterium]
MNLPSSLALSQSKFFQSRLGILLLALVGLAIVAGVFLMRREPKAPVMPTPATSPAAQALPRPSALPKPVYYGPPAPVWARTDIQYGPSIPPELAIHVPPPPPAAPAQASIANPPGPAVAVPGAPVTPAPALPVPVATAVPAPAVPVPVATVVPATPPPAPAVAAQAPAAAAAQAPAQAPAPAIPAPTAASGEIPKSVDASVLFAREHYNYTAGGRRDPYQSLIEGKYQTLTGDGSLVDVGDIHLVGIMWGSSDKFALVEDSRGHGYVLRVGDPVVNGYISGIGKSELQVVQNAFGESQTLSIHLQTKEGDKNATRN